MRDRGSLKGSAWGWALGLFAVAALVMGVASGKGGKPDKPPPEPDTGCIYYLVGNWWDEVLWVMDTDGTNKTELSDLSGVPSLELHGGERWFLEERDVGGTYPDGRNVRELFAYNESKTITVQLTDDPLREIHKWHGSMWAPGDWAISWPAHTWIWDDTAQEYVVGEAGIYYLELEYDSDGNILEPDSSSEPLVATYCGYTLAGGVVVPDLSGCTWSPDHTRVTYSVSFDTGYGMSPPKIYVTDILTPNEAEYLTDGLGPQWSAADIIGFAGGPDRGIYIINPDGTGRTQLHSERSNTTMSGPRFAPDGIRFAFMVYYPPGPSDPMGDGTNRIYTSSTLKPKANDLRTEGQGVQWR